LGPTKLATAIFYATLTNIIAYLPFLMLSAILESFSKPPHRHDHGAVVCISGCHDLCSTAGLLHSTSAGLERIDFGGKAEAGFYGFYNRLVGRAIQHRWSVLAGSFVFLLIGGFAASHLKSQFFPEDVQYWFTSTSGCPTMFH